MKMLQASVIRERIIVDSVMAFLQEIGQIMFAFEFVNLHMYKKSVEQEMEL
jgi:hypothetical protein